MTTAGLISVLPHIITVAGIWLAIIIIVRIVKIGLFKGMDSVQADLTQKRHVERVVSLVHIGATVAAASIIVIIVFFLSSPLERPHEDIETISEAVIDEGFKRPTRSEIEKSNKEVVEKKHKEKARAAEKDNKDAMEEATKLFR